MARRKGWLDIHRKKHGFFWWIIIGWWLRPIASVFWLLWADILGFKGVKYHYYK